jgi:hypothetical protein
MVSSCGLDSNPLSMTCSPHTHNLAPEEHHQMEGQGYLSGDGYLVVDGRRQYSAHTRTLHKGVRVRNAIGEKRRFVVLERVLFIRLLEFICLVFGHFGLRGSWEVS